MSMKQQGTRGRPKRKDDYVRVGLNVPVTSKAKLDEVSKALNETRTDILVQLIKETSELYKTDTK